MRRRRSNVSLRRVIGCCLLLGLGRAAHAQTGIRAEAPYLVFPTGARVLGMGQAGVATAVGVEALWWNPALVAHGPREVDMGLVTGAMTTDADVNLGFVYPIPHVISFGVSLRYIDFGQQDALDSTGTITTGSFRPTADILTGTVAAPFGDRLAIGLSVKMLALPFNRTGEVPQAPSDSPITGALDVGAQYIARTDSVLIFGAAFRNIGLPLQVNDAPQADQLPGRAEFGAQFKPRFPTYPQVEALVAGDVIMPLGAGGPGYRLGGELSWAKTYHARAGYVVDGPTGSGPTLGVGASFVRWRVDFAQFLNDMGVDGSKKPTYLSIRYAF